MSTIYFFKSDHCPACEEMIQELGSDLYASGAAVEFVNVRDPARADMVGRFDVKYTPSMVVLQSTGALTGGSLVGKVVSRGDVMDPAKYRRVLGQLRRT